MTATVLVLLLATASALQLPLRARANCLLGAALRLLRRTPLLKLRDALLDRRHLLEVEHRRVQEEEGRKVDEPRDRVRV